jgi:pseudouridine-5'-phosphate glycosidase
VVQAPPAHAALAADIVDDAVDAALAAGRHAGVRGAAVTPFLLAEVERRTHGASVQTNLALLEANAALAGAIAVALAAPSEAAVTSAEPLNLSSSTRYYPIVV